jgi:hypothetical protein
MRREKDSRERKKNGCDHKFNGAQNAVEALYSNNEYKKSARNCLVSIEVRDRSTMLLVVYITKAFNRQGQTNRHPLTSAASASCSSTARALAKACNRCLRRAPRRLAARTACKEEEEEEEKNDRAKMCE